MLKKYLKDRKTTQWFISLWERYKYHFFAFFVVDFVVFLLSNVNLFSGLVIGDFDSKFSSFLSTFSKISFLVVYWS